MYSISRAFVLRQRAHNTKSAQHLAVLLDDDHDDEKLRVLLVPEEWATSSSPRSLASTVSLPPG